MQKYADDFAKLQMLKLPTFASALISTRCSLYFFITSIFASMIICLRWAFADFHLIFADI